MLRFLTEAGTTGIAQHFLTYYSHPEERHWKMRRFLEARAFLKMNHGRFEEFYTTGNSDGEGGMLSARFLHALWRIFSHATDDIANHRLPVEHVLHVARHP